MAKPKTTPYIRRRDSKTRELFYEHRAVAEAKLEQFVVLLFAQCLSRSERVNFLCKGLRVHPYSKIIILTGVPIETSPTR
jgi:hypothetical protein